MGRLRKGREFIPEGCTQGLPLLKVHSMEGSSRAKNKTPATSEVLECAGNSGQALWEVFGTEAIHLTGRLDGEQLEMSDLNLS